MDKLGKRKQKDREGDVRLEQEMEERIKDLVKLNIKYQKEISLRKKAEEIAGLAYSELNQIFNAAEPLCVIDKNYNITRFNSSFARLFNLKEEEPGGIVNQKCYHTWKVNYCNTNNCPIKKITNGEKPEEYIMKKKTSGGKNITCIVSSVPFRDSGGKSIGILSSFSDITEREEAIRQARLREEQLLQADKMASLGILVSGVAHEINNPNSFISMNAPILHRVWKALLPVLEEHYRQGGELDTGGMTFPEIRKMIPEILTGLAEGAKRINKIVISLKNFARKESLESEDEVDISRIVASALTLLNNLIRKSTNKFSVTYGPDIPTFKGNFQQIEQVVVNLLINACQALPDNSKGVSISTAYDSAEQYIVLIVRDEGTGITHDIKNKIFDPFFTTKRDTGGTGLGLSITSNIIKAHNGIITVESSSQKGTTFKVTIPVFFP